jgi:hypothetical protein
MQLDTSGSLGGTVTQDGHVRAAAGVGERRKDLFAAVGLFLSLLVIYNANGREIGSYDTQPSKFAARELLLYGTLDLDRVVAATPQYATRWGFMLAADGHYRSVYSPVPPIMAAAVTWPLWTTGIIDVRAPLAPAAIAVITASTLVALAVTMAFFTARQQLGRVRALLLALGLGLGTGWWSTASQTLWQTESAVFGLALAVLAFTLPRERIGATAAIAIGAGLGLAGATRPQLAPIVGILLAGTWIRSRPRNAALCTAIVAASVAALCATNLRWFAHPLGALPLLQEVNSRVHATGASFGLDPEGFVGLLVSPNRGLLVYSPVVLVALMGIRRCLVGWRSPHPWCMAGLAAQYLLYGTYAVWWGGHTYGPRYLLDVLPLAVPLAAVAMARPEVGPIAQTAAAAALAWSMVVAATGAFCYPNERWNVDPADVDRHHSRLWDVSDNQIRRCWTRGMSPQNFSLMDRAAFRQVTP